MPRVSIIIPAFNAERFLARSLESVQAQTITDWESVVVDDGSTDGTAEVASAYVREDPRVRLVQQPNAGVAAARNRGMADASAASEYAVFLDADDMWEKDALEQLLSALAANPMAVAASGLSRVVDDHDQPQEPGELEVWGRHRLAVAGSRLVLLPVRQPTTFAVLAYRNCIYTPGQMVVRRTALQFVGPFDPATSPCEDWDMSLRLSQRGDILLVDRVVLNWRKHGANASSQGELMARQMLRVRQKLLAWPDLTDEQRDIARHANRILGSQMCAQKLHEARRSLVHGQLRHATRLLRSAIRVYAEVAKGAPVS